MDARDFILGQEPTTLPPEHYAYKVIGDPSEYRSAQRNGFYARGFLEKMPRRKPADYVHHSTGFEEEPLALLRFPRPKDAEDAGHLPLPYPRLRPLRPLPPEDADEIEAYHQISRDRREYEYRNDVAVITRFSKVKVPPESIEVSVGEGWQPIAQTPWQQAASLDWLMIEASPVCAKQAIRETRRQNRYNPLGLHRDRDGRLLDKYGRVMEPDWQEFEKRRTKPEHATEPYLRPGKQVNPMHNTVRLKSS